VAVGVLFSGAFAYGYIVQWVFCLWLFDLVVFCQYVFCPVEYLSMGILLISVKPQYRIYSAVMVKRFRTLPRHAF